MNHHHKTAAIRLVVGLLLSGWLGGCGEGGGVGDVAALRPALWDGLDALGFQVRTDASAPGSLLLTVLADERASGASAANPGNHGPVYRFDANSMSFTSVADEEWDRVGGEVRDCLTWQGPDTGFHVEPPTASERFLYFDDAPVATAGRVTIDFFPAFEAEAAAVVSTTGNAGFGGFFFLGGATPVTGQLYHQLFSTVDGAPIGSPVRLPFRNPRAYQPEACWSADEHFVVYFSEDNSETDTIVVVPVEDDLGPLAPIHQSDVDCITPTDWPHDRFELYARRARDGKTWLLSPSVDNGGESGASVLALDGGAGTPYFVDAGEWEALETQVIPVVSRLLSASPLALPADGRGVLLVNGSEQTLDSGIPIDFAPALERDVAAVLSTDGRAVPGEPVMGNLLHQLFWEDSGSPVGPPLRLGFEDPNGGDLSIGWTPDEHFVVYDFVSYRESTPDMVCVAPVEEEVRDVRLQRASDVPFINPSAWPDEFKRMLLRRDEEDPHALLLTALTEEQDETDPYIRELKYSGHGAVYRYDPDTRYISHVIDHAWDAATTTELACGRWENNELYFRSCNEDAVVRWPGRGTYEVAGVTGVAIFGAPGGDLSAVLSTDRSAPYCFFDFPMPGQHYHQIVSSVDITPTRKALRLPMGGLDVSSVEACWTEDNEYIVYFQGIPGTRTVSRFCVVDASR